MALREGGSLYLEFWTGEGRRQHEGQLVAAVPADVVAAELEQRGAVIVHREEARVESASGSPGQTQEPTTARVVARLVAQWQR
jgi:hypothetical protein